MTISLIVATSLLRFLDPFTGVSQADDAREGTALKGEIGCWPVSQGGGGPLPANSKPRVVHPVFRGRHLDPAKRAWKKLP